MLKVALNTIKQTNKQTKQKTNNISYTSDIQYIYSLCWVFRFTEQGSLPFV